ncbi:MAG: tetratricopeptide repeat protein [Micropepsaceae bacterium]
MRRLGVIVVAAAALAIGASDASAKPKPKGVSVSERDVQTCLGANGGTAKEQIPACTKVINSGKIKHPYEADYYAVRGGAYFELKQYDKALADLNKAISIRATPEIYFQRALTHLSNENSDGAKADLAQVMKLKPEFSASYFMRGLISYRAEEYAEAVTYFDGAVKRLPTYYQALFARGVAKKRAGDESGGDKDIKDARGMSSHVEADMQKLGLKP